MRSFSAMRNQVGYSLQAGLVIGSSRHFRAIGFCVAAMRAVSDADAFGATALRKASTVSQMNPSASGWRFGALGWGGTHRQRFLPHPGLLRRCKQAPSHSDCRQQPR
jgi:hypothetical protein